MRVLQVCHDYSGPFTQICRQYTAAFAGHSIVTVFLKGAPDEQVRQRVGGDEVHFLGATDDELRGIKVKAIRALAGLTRGQTLDVVIAHRYKAIYLVGMLSYLQHLPLMIGVIHEHEVFRRVTRRLFVTFWRRAFFIGGVSASVRGDIARDCPSLVSRGRLLTLPNSIDPRQKQTYLSREAARRHLGVAAGEIIIGTIGRLVEKKRQAYLVRAFAGLKEPQLRLVIIGDGPELAGLKRMVSEEGLEGRVRFMGFIDEARTLVRGFDLFVLTSGEEEAFGVVLLEAMLGSVPVLSSDAPGPREVLGDAGLMFRSHDVLSLARELATFLAMAPEARATLGRQGYARVESAWSDVAFRDRLAAVPGLERL